MADRRHIRVTNVAGEGARVGAQYGATAADLEDTEQDVTVTNVAGPGAQVGIQAGIIRGGVHLGD